MAQEQQGNGLIGGGIGLIGGGILAAKTGDSVGRLVTNRLSGEAPTVFRVNKEAINKEMWDTPQDQWRQTTDMLGRPRPVTPSDEYHARVMDAYDKEIKSKSAYNSWADKRRQIEKASILLYQLGLPITTALLGSTLTD